MKVTKRNMEYFGVLFMIFSSKTGSKQSCILTVSASWLVTKKKMGLRRYLRGWIKDHDGMISIEELRLNYEGKNQR